MTFRIDYEFKDYLGALDDEAKVALEQSLMAEGCRDALIVWPQPEGDAILLDGHNRFAICEDLGIPYRVIECSASIADREGAVAWIIQNQRARRNMTPDQLRYLIGKVYQAEKKSPWRPLKDDANFEVEKGVQNEHLSAVGKTEGKIAAEFGVSPTTVRRNEKFVETVDAISAEHGPEAKAEILAGRAKVSDYRTPLYADVEPLPELIPPPPGEMPPPPVAPSPPLKRTAQAGYDMIAKLRECAEVVTALRGLGFPTAATEPAVKTTIFHVREALCALERHLNQEPEE